MKRFFVLLLMAAINATYLMGTAYSQDEKKAQTPEGFDCVECTLTRGPAVVLEEDVEPAEHMEKFVSKLPVTESVTTKNMKKNGISRSPAIVSNPE